MVGTIFWNHLRSPKTSETVSITSIIKQMYCSSIQKVVLWSFREQKRSMLCDRSLSQIVEHFTRTIRRCFFSTSNTIHMACDVPRSQLYPDRTESFVGKHRTSSSYLILYPLCRLTYGTGLYCQTRYVKQGKRF